MLIKSIILEAVQEKTTFLSLPVIDAEETIPSAGIIGRPQTVGIARSDLERPNHQAPFTTKISQQTTSS